MTQELIIIIIIFLICAFNEQTNHDLGFNVCSLRLFGVLSLHFSAFPHISCLRFSGRSCVPRHGVGGDCDDVRPISSTCGRIMILLHFNISDSTRQAISKAVSD